MRPPGTTPAPSEPASLAAAARVALLYTVVSVLWIALSDRLVATLFDDPAHLTAAQTLKGWAFVLASAAFIFYLVRRELVRFRGSEARFRAVLEQSLAGVYMIRRGRFLFVNSRLAEIFGYEAEEMVRSLRISDVVAPEDRERVLDNLEARESGERDELHYTFRGLHRRGHAIQVEVFGKRAVWQGRTVVIGVLLDISERASLEEQVRRAQKLETIGELTGAVAHDFNNLLTAIIAPLELALADLPPDPGVRTQLEEVLETANRAAQLTRQLLSFSRKRVSQPRVVDLNELLCQGRPMVDRLSGQGIQVQYQLSPALATVRIDPSHLEQVVVNLVVNARDAMPGGGHLTIRTYDVIGSRTEPDEAPEETPAGRWTCLEVRDTGSGFDESVRGRIFEPFFTTKDKGTGLGLSTVFGIVRQAGGFVTVQSARGQGAVFRVHLPGLAEAAEAVERRAAPTSDSRGAETVLVVEDEDPVRRVVVAALRRAGYRVMAAGDPDTALDLARSHDGPLHLLLTDVMLPGVRGPDLAERVGREQPGARVLYTSGYSDEETLGHLLATGRPEFLEKPFSVDELLLKVRSVLEGPAPGRGVAGA